tara:strand:+ start:5585 stop:6004 length:420 start_codon:yes stop_codon:yes gene_type:complete
MRSVFVLFPTSQESLVRDWLDHNTVRAGDNNWHVPDAERPVLFCAIGRLFDDWEAGELAMVRSVIGESPLFVQVDVSGGVSGAVAVLETVAGLLEAVAGSVAQDGYTSHLWQLAELREGAHVQGHPFFDCQGWYDEQGG